MKSAFLSSLGVIAILSAVVAAVGPGPSVLEYPAGTACRTWSDGGDVYLHVTNFTEVAVSGTVILNEIFEKLQCVGPRHPAEIDGRWIEIELPPRAAVTLRLGK